MSKAVAERSEDGTLIARYDVSVRSDGTASYKRLENGDRPSGTGREWFCYAEYQPPCTWWNGGTYVDTLSKEALASFITMTHERYYQHFAKEFGNVVPSIFTDEPQFAKKEYLSVSHAIRDIFLPWTHDLPQTFKARYGTDLLDHLPELVWDMSDEPSLARYQYHDHVCDRFVEAFMDQLSDWCRSHGIALTGHLMQEPRLMTQTESLGEAMRGYRNLDVPGIDMLCDAREYNTAKQATSVARQNGVKGVMSEEYGVTNWTFDFKGHKASGDWQAALGVTFRVHREQHTSVDLRWHMANPVDLTPVSMLGESKRDYPAAIGYQSPWYKEYKYIEDHFSRLNVALTRGKPVARVAVIHPVESFWLTYGPADRNGREQVWRDKAFKDLTDWFLLGLIDFDFVSESLFPEQTSLDDLTSNTLPVGHARYDVVVLANLRTIRSTTVARLQKFAAKGGKVIVTGGMPTLLDVRPAQIDLAATLVPFTQFDLITALEPYRDVRITRNGTDVKSLMYQLRRDGDERFLFVCDVARDDPIDTTVSVRGTYDVIVLDTLAGTEWKVDSSAQDGWTSFDWTFWSCGHVLVRLVPRRPSQAKGHHVRVQPAYEMGFNQLSQVTLERVSLSEPNVLLLDQASWKLGDDAQWQPETEVLRIDNLVRARLGLPLKDISLSQPWTRTPAEREPISTLHLRFAFESAVDLDDGSLAVERLESTTVRLDGREISSTRTGWFVDEDISVMRLGAISSGKHVLELDMPFGRLANVERVYLLGDFAVRLYGDVAIIDRLDLSLLRFGDYTRQGLPFYAGNVTYHCTFDVPLAQHIVLQTYQFAGPAVTATVDGRDKHNLSLPPHVADVGHVEAGRHTVDFTLYGNRENAFGALHMPKGETDYWGPNAWRGDQNYWQDEYDVKPMGITIRPVVRGEGMRKYVVTVRRRHDTH
jgi:hypothetical protein